MFCEKLYNVSVFYQHFLPTYCQLVYCSAVLYVKYSSFLANMGKYLPTLFTFRGLNTMGIWSNDNQISASN